LNGGWQDTTVTLPPGNWRGEFCGEVFSGSISPEACFKEFPVALLVRCE
jgi:(1->4)-alpha-D-glucan 1-alpha-D-glucosylmutase